MRSGLYIVFGLVILTGACGGDESGNGNDPDASTGTPDASGTGDGGGTDARRGNACDRVDLVFAVDSSTTMEEELAAMASEVFPEFIQRLRAIGGGNEDYRIGVLDTCPVNANFHKVRDNDTPEGESCNFSSGEVWMESNSPNLDAEFSCVTNMFLGDYDREGEVGVVCTGDMDDEQPITTAIQALTTFSEPGQPNEGFLRDNALLVVVAITDEDEKFLPPLGPEERPVRAQELYDQLLALKGGMQRVVVLGIGGVDTVGVDGCNGVYGDAEEARQLKLTTDLFVAQQRGVFWNICQGSLADSLEEAMNVIEKVCNQVD